jgi:hypothetical protein
MHSLEAGSQRVDFCRAAANFAGSGLSPITCLMDLTAGTARAGSGTQRARAPCWLTFSHSVLSCLLSCAVCAVGADCLSLLKNESDPQRLFMACVFVHFSHTCLPPAWLPPCNKA